jgi:hypothetical protein
MASKAELKNQILKMLDDAFAKKLNSYLEQIGKWNFISNLIVVLDDDFEPNEIDYALKQKVEFSQGLGFEGMWFDPYAIRVDSNGELEIYMIFYLEENEIYDDDFEAQVVYKNKQLQLDNRVKGEDQFLDIDLDALHNQIEHNLFKSFLGG